MQSDWLGLRKELPERRRFLLTFLSFALPLLLWGLISYVPWIWHPMVRIQDPGDAAYFQPDMLITRTVFTQENKALRASGGREASGIPANPIYLPAPHEVGRALVKAFQTPPRLPSEPWLHQSLWHSIQIIFWGFTFSSLLGLPLGILCGSFRAIARLSEPFIEFFRYLPAPAFGALCVAMMGIHDAPKIAIIFIGTFFQQVLVISNTTRQIDPVLLESALTLGASKAQLVWRVIIPGTITGIYNDMRILLGWAWTYLIVAELIGATSGITYFINQQGRYRNYENVYAAIMMIGIIGLGTDILLAWLGKYIFPWKRGHLKMPWEAFMNFLRPPMGRVPAKAKPASKP
jgi:NitT/TauT family transport system permease protein